MVTPKIAIHSGKVFKSVRGGVKVLDANTMQWRFVSNTWYVDDTLAQVFQNRTNRIKAKRKLRVAIFL